MLQIPSKPVYFFQMLIQLMFILFKFQFFFFSFLAVILFKDDIPAADSI